MARHGALEAGFIPAFRGALAGAAGLLGILPSVPHLHDYSFGALDHKGPLDSRHFALLPSWLALLPAASDAIGLLRSGSSHVFAPIPGLRTLLFTIPGNWLRFAHCWRGPWVNF
jgi:hypothetical protein